MSVDRYQYVAQYNFYYVGKLYLFQYFTFIVLASKVALVNFKKIKRNFSI
jgi:hypothetical protein